MDFRGYHMKCGSEGHFTGHYRNGYFLYICPKCKIVFSGDVMDYGLKDYYLLDVATLSFSYRGKSVDECEAKIRRQKEEMLIKLFGKEILLEIKV